MLMTLVVGDFVRHVQPRFCFLGFRAKTQSRTILILKSRDVLVVKDLG